MENKPNLIKRIINLIFKREKMNYYVVKHLDRSIQAIKSKDQEKKEEEKEEQLKKEIKNYSPQKPNILRNLILITLNDYVGPKYPVAMGFAIRVRDAKDKVTFNENEKEILLNGVKGRKDFPAYLKYQIENSILNK